MKKIMTSVLIFLLTLSAVGAENISGYVGFSTGYEFNILTTKKTQLDKETETKMNIQGVPFYIEGETYFCPWVGGYYGIGVYTIPTVLESGDVSFKPYGEGSPTIYTTPYLGLALRYDFTDLIAMVFNTGLSYTAWKIPVDERSSDFIHMLNIKCDLALGIHPMHNMGIRIGLKVDTPVYAGFRFADNESGIRLGDTSAKAYGVKLVPYIGIGYAYGR